jgi:uncharacterized protein (TIGR01777 family)
VTKTLVDRGDTVVALSRDPGRATSVLGNERIETLAWARPTGEPPPKAALSGADAVIHLLGEPIAQRWTERAKREILDSRVLGTRSLVAGLSALADDRRPKALVSQSATGYYGPHGDEPVEESAPAGADFLATVAAAWECEAAAASARLRVVTPRTGVVLADGGALAKMLPPFRLGVGGPVAGGRQYVPWIHLDDVADALLLCAGDERVSGPVNLTAPNPVTNAELSKTLGRVLNRPAVMPVPGAALRLLYGEMAATVLTGQRAIPSRLLELGYRFRYRELEPALREAVVRKGA